MARKPIDFYESPYSVTCYEDGSSEIEISYMNDEVYVRTDDGRESVLIVFTREEFDRLMTICSKLRDLVQCQPVKESVSASRFSAGVSSS